MIVAVEDALSEAVVRRMVAEVRPDLTIYHVMRKNGLGYIRANVRKWNVTANKVPVFVLVDLDRPDPCPADLISELLPVPHGSYLLFRVAVMEIESWLLADAEGLAQFLAVSRDDVPNDPDALEQPKEFIVSLAAKSKRRDIRADLVPSSGDTRKVGAAFNPRLIAFIANDWSLERATTASPSLRKAVERLRSAF